MAEPEPSPGDGEASSRASPFAIGGVVLPPGTRRRLEIPVARLPVGTPMSLSIEVVHGRKPGPALWLSGAIHGDELDGVEIIHRVLDGLRADRLAGTVVAVPIVNMFGALYESRYLPDRRDLNRSFPGSPGGSLAAQLAHLFMEEVVSPCQWGIDFHCGSDDRENLPQVRGDLADPETRRIALAFAAPVTVPGKPPDGSLRKAAVKDGARVILYEGGEAWRFSPAAIETGIAGTRRVLAALGMIGPSGAESPDTVEARRTQWLRAVRSGICRIDVALGDRVKRNQRIAVIRDLTGSESKSVRARSAGIVIGRRINPLVYKGEAVAHVAVP